MVAVTARLSTGTGNGGDRAPAEVSEPGDLTQDCGTLLFQVGEELELKRVMPAGAGPPPGAGGGMRMPMEIMARKLGPEEAKKRLAALAPPPKLPLPELKDLPDNGLARTPPMGWNRGPLERPGHAGDRQRGNDGCRAPDPHEPVGE